MKYDLEFVLKAACIVNASAVVAFAVSVSFAGTDGSREQLVAQDRPPSIFIIEIERMPDPRDGRYMIHYSINGVPHTVFAPDAETREGFLEWLLYLGLGGGQ